MTVDPAALTRLLRHAGHDAVVGAVTPLSGGASSATFAVDAMLGTDPWPLIFQQSAGVGRDAGSEAMTKATQAALQRIVGAHGVPVAAVVAVAEPGDDLGDGLVMARVEGESLAPKWLRGEGFTRARDGLTGQCAAALAALHAVPIAAVAGLPLPAGSARAQGERLFDHYRGFDVDEPVFDLAFAWLREHLPDDAATAVCHGDFRSGNLIVGPDGPGQGLRAVLDWELAHLGDPHADLGWLCVNAWRFGVWRRPVGGFGERADLYAAYEAAGGVAVDPARAHVFEVFGTLKWGISCLQLADDHVSGRVRSVERAAIGRRVSEVAADLLHLLKNGTI